MGLSFDTVGIAAVIVICGVIVFFAIWRR